MLKRLLTVSLVALTATACASVLAPPPQRASAPAPRAKAPSEAPAQAPEATPAAKPAPARRQAAAPVAKPAPAPAPKKVAAAPAPRKPTAAEERAAKKAAEDKARADAYRSFSAAHARHTEFVDLMRELSRTTHADFSLAHPVDPGFLVALVDQGKRAEAAFAPCAEAWRPILADRKLRPNPGEVCGLMKTWRPTVTKLAEWAFERDRKHAVASMKEWATRLATRGEAWDDSVVALANPTAWATARWSRWKAPFAALGAPPPLDFTIDVEEKAVGVSLADAAREQRFTARDNDARAQAAATFAVQAAGLEVLGARSVMADWIVAEEGGQPVHRHRVVQVLAKKPGERFCRVYAMNVRQRFDAQRGAYQSAETKLVPAEGFLVSRCK